MRTALPLLDAPFAVPTRPWLPQRVVVTPAARAEPHGRAILRRCEALGLPVEELKSNRLTGLRGGSERETYRLAKSTLAVVTAPPSAFKLRPIPPSADWQFHLAEGCPAHCQYCYLAGSLSGPPVVRAFANLPAVLANLPAYERPGEVTTFEVSCYTDPLAVEHLTGGLAECVRHFAGRPGAQLRWVSKFDAVDGLLGLPHAGRTRCRASVNASAVERFEGGTPRVDARLAGLRKLALAGYPVGVVVAPIMPVPDWRAEYAGLFDRVAAALDSECDLTFEFITHRFTPGSKDVLLGWYLATRLEMDEAKRSAKLNKFGGRKYVYPAPVMRELREFFLAEAAARFPSAEVLYWT